ncbi:Hpt domain-containing protein [Terriglobus aquaticus]|uniref:Hpt domain-containing protein n=1 Tax=Terriglobus aquaticus TaxID=940139 RepID=A0ABW9KMQ3_9BACT|nr:Hpt domain-containing protein [Terriglobus aquaticus]
MNAGSTQAAIAAIWRRQVPQTRERLGLLRKAADHLAETRTMEPDLRAQALDIAHKLAGSLGMFGYFDATDHARAIELELHHTGLPQPERLEQHVTALEASLQQALN